MTSQQLSTRELIAGRAGAATHIDTAAAYLRPAEQWFASKAWTPFQFQRDVWQAYLAGESGLVHAATGTGKTLAAWWGPLLEWIADKGMPQPDLPNERSKTPPLRVLWLTPLRALAGDTKAALAQPLCDLGIPWSLELRTSDSSAAVKSRQERRLPTALITTPESLSILLTRSDAAAQFSALRAVIVDEWHELLGTKRGVQVELALARLRRVQPDLRVWGLSATIGNLTEANEVLSGAAAVRRPSRIVRGVEVALGRAHEEAQHQRRHQADRPGPELDRFLRVDGELIGPEDASQRHPEQCAAEDRSGEGQGDGGWTHPGTGDAAGRSCDGANRHRPDTTMWQVVRPPRRKIAATARHARARLPTRDRRAAATYEHLGIDDEILV